MRKINIIGRCANIYRGDKLKSLDIADCQHTYIIVLCRYPGISQDELAKRIYINKSNVTRHLSQLEKNGYVERRQSEEDKRVTLVYPTEKAYNALPTIMEVIKTWNSYLTQDFTEDELELFGVMLTKIFNRATESVNKVIEDD